MGGGGSPLGAPARLVEGAGAAGAAEAQQVARAAAGPLEDVQVPVFGFGFGVGFWVRFLGSVLGFDSGLGFEFRFEFGFVSVLVSVSVLLTVFALVYIRTIADGFTIRYEYCAIKFYD